MMQQPVLTVPGPIIPQSHVTIQTNALNRTPAKLADVQGWDILVNRLSLHQVVSGLLSVLVMELALLL